MKKERVEQIVQKIKQNIEREILKKNWDHVLELVSLCASVLYETNICYTDIMMESCLQQAAAWMKEDSLTFRVDNADDNTIVFYDGFGLNDRGLAKNYLLALGENKKVIYVTFESRKSHIPDILRIVRDYGGEVWFLGKGTKTAQIRQLHDCVCKVQAKHFLFYGHPYDTVATTLLYGFEGVLTRYQINLTDHAFWLGTGCIDQCIEFRDYGANISNEYRKIPREKISVLPYYPFIDYEQPFLGYPFSLKEGQKVVFSGGSLYKTMGEGNQYYRIVDEILSRHEETVFWYAGRGDDREIRKCMDRYRGRVFLTEERPDLYQVLRHCRFFLNTYPVSGALMYQYAACAGRVPVTLRFDEDNDGMLICQKNLRVDFETPEELLNEVCLLINDESYYQERCRQMQGTVISEKAFSETLNGILENRESPYTVDYMHLDTAKFRERGWSVKTEKSLNRQFVRKSGVMLLLRYHPVRFLSGAFQILQERFQKR